MDFSVRSPHGDADVSVDADDAATLADLIVAVTGQAVPRLLLVDGRPVLSSTPVLGGPVRSGSVVSVENHHADAPPTDTVRLVQLAGSGAGRTTELEPGRYRLGPARRLSDHELQSAPVEDTALDLDVQADGSVRVTAVADDVRIGNDVPTEPTVLGERAVTTATRMFVVDHERTEPGVPTDESVGPDGAVLINRPLVATPVTRGRRRPVLDALETATSRGAALWPRRPDDSGATAVVVGVTVDDDGVWSDVSVPLLDRGMDGVGIVGSEQVRSGLARTMLAELAVERPPADLQMVIVSSNPSAWEWAKWLPHLQDHRRPAIVRPGDLGALLGAHSGPGRSTLVVVDDPAIWMRTDGALRGRWDDLPPDTSVLALCSTRSEVPSVCTFTIDEQRSGRISVSGARRATVPDVLPAVADPATVERVARHLTPLVDADDRRDSRPHATTDWSSFCDVAADIDADGIRRRWAERRPLDCPTTVLVRAAALQTALDVASGLTVDLALRRPPDSLRVVAITERETAFVRLPHSEPSRPLDEGSRSLARIGVDRFGQRLRSLLADPTGPDHAVIVVAVGSDASPRSADLLASLVTLAGDDVTVIVATDRDRPADTLDPVRTIEVDELAGRFQLRIDDTNGAREVAIARPRSTSLDVRAFVHGRHPTPAERRIDQQRPRHVDPALERLVRLATDAAGPRVDVRSLFPAPRPERLDMAELLDRHPGDAVPLGLLDRPELDAEQVWWWRPDGSSTLAIGGPAAVTRTLIRALLVGVGARFGDDDIGVITLSSAAPLRAFAAGLTQSLLVIGHDEISDQAAADVERLLDDHPAPTVILVDDLPALRRAATNRDVDGWIRGLLERSTVVATSDEVDGDDLTDRFTHRVLGAVADVDAARVGIAHPPSEPAHGLLLRTEQPVTLATPADDDVDPDGATDGTDR